jgi:ATP-dependent exoDNAse (exonuclease V) alpha subunit
MNTLEFYKSLKNAFPFETTLQQDVFFQHISAFLTQENQGVFVLKGYAGTGKTSVVTTLVNALPNTNKQAVMLAPTGRAAKVMSAYAGKNAFTIHKRIYFPKKGKSGQIGFVLQPNKFKNTVFIVDESSMISDEVSDNKIYANGSLLDDLFFYVESGTNCKLLLVGDTAQLPPVNSEVSPALDVQKLGINYQKEIFHIELNEVMRQANNSGILTNATALREILQMHFLPDFKFNIQKFKDIKLLQDGYEIEDAINLAYSKYSEEDTAIIVRSNKRANQYNQQIRIKILGRDSELSSGDLLMVVKNNYFWLDEKSQAGFIANGDIIEIQKIIKIEELYGFTFAKVMIKLIDYPNEPTLETILLLDTLQSESPSLTYQESNTLYQEVMADYQDEVYAYKKLLKVKNNPYFNALQVKFAYAITCHKSQGGQWKTVFVEKPYLPDGISIDYVRWLYTAITRASEQLYLIGYKPEDTENY